jgi:hypothetical protein
MKPIFFMEDLSPKIFPDTPLIIYIRLAIFTLQDQAGSWYPLLTSIPVLEY